MCHSSDYWMFRSRRQPDKTEASNRSDANRSDKASNQADAGLPSVEPIEAPRKDERIRREKELERVS